MLKHQRLEYSVLETVSWDDNIRAVFDLSLNTLRQRNRQRSIEIFCALSACEPQGFSMTDALVVADINNQILIKTNLLELIRLSLIRGDLNTRMSMHPFVREYARELAKSENILDIARQRYSEYYVDLVISTGPDSDDEYVSDLSLTELEKNLDAIRHATHWLLYQNDPLRNQKFWRGLRPVYETRAYTDFAVHLMQQFSDIANKHGDLALQAYFYRQLGKAYRKTNDLNNALEAMQRGLELERQRGDDSLIEQGKALDSIGRIYLQKRNSTKAIELHRESLRIAEQLNDEENLSFALAGLAISLGRSKVEEHRDEAIECAGKAIKVAQNLNTQSKILTYREIGKVYNLTDRSDDAVRILTEAIELFDSELVDAPSTEYTLIEALINAHQKNKTKGETDKRTQYLQRIVSRIEVNKNERYYQHSALRYYFSLIDLYFNSGNVYGSLKHCQEALKIAKRKNSSFNTAKAQCLLAHVLLSHQRPNEALTHLDQGIPVLESQTSLNYQNQRLFNQAQQNKGAALWTIGEKKEAIAQRWRFVEYLIKTQKQKYYKSVICGRLANWLYSYGQDVTFRMESDEIAFVDKMFEEVLNADPGNRYIQYDFAQYQEYKILKNRFTSLAQINSLLKNLSDLTASYRVSLEDSNKKIAALKATLGPENQDKSTNKVNLYKEQGRSFNLGQGIKRLDDHWQKLIEIKNLWKDWEDGRLGGKRLLQLARKLRFAGYDHAALYVIKQSLGNTFNENLYFELTQLYRGLNDIDNAFQCFTELINNKDKYFYRIQFGDFLAKNKKDVQAAEEQYQSAKEQRSFKSEPYDRLGTLYWIHDFQPQKADEFFSEAFSLIIRGKENDPDKISQTVANSLMFYADIGNCDRVEEIIQKMPDNLMNYTSIKLVINRARFACKRIDKSAVDLAFKEALREYQARFEKALPHDKGYWSNQLSHTNWQYGQFFEQFGNPKGAGKHYRRACELTYYKKTDFLGAYVLWAFYFGKNQRTAEQLLDDLRRLDSQHPAIKQVEKLQDEGS
jgi:hypothetical protein